MRELLESVDSRELSEWAQFANVEPFGDDWRPGAQVASILHNVHRAKEAPALQADDFMPIKQIPKPQSAEQVLAIFKGLQTLD